MEIDSFWCQNGFQVHIFSVRDFVGKVKDYFYFYWDMKRDGIPVLRGKQSQFIFIQMKEHVNQNGFKVQNIAVNERGGLL